MLSFHASQTKANLLKINLIILTQLIKKNTFVLTNALYLFGVIKSAKVDARTAFELYTVLLECAKFRQRLFNLDFTIPFPTQYTVMY